MNELLKIDLGCGTNKKDGFLGVDSIAFEGVDLVADLRKPWPWQDDTVDEAHASHFIEHLTAQERVFFVNELYRVLKSGARATLIIPHWASSRAYGDPTHQWPPVSEFWFYYLSRIWRVDQKNAPHTDAQYLSWGFKCHFEATFGYNIHPQVALRNTDYQQFAVNFYKEAASDIVATLIKR